MAENERLRAENAVLRERLANVQAIALEREQRIEDLKHALRMLPSVWARKLEQRLGSGAAEQEVPGIGQAAVAEATDVQPADVQPEEVPAVAEPAHVQPTTAAPVTAEPELHPDRAEAILVEVAALRSRLERKRLEIERQMLEQERRKIQADLAWTRKWRRFRKVRSPGA